MALAEKYRVYLYNGFGGDDRYIQIYKEGYSGAVTNLKGTAQPANLSIVGAGDDDIFENIMGTELAVNVVIETTDQLSELINATSKDYFARVVRMPVLDYISNWFLPATNQLTRMEDELYDFGIGGFTAGRYWSSTENSATNAIAREINTSTSHGVSKDTEYRIRPCREFTAAAGAYAVRDVGPGGGHIFEIVNASGTIYYYETYPIDLPAAAWSNVTTVAIGITSYENGKLNTDYIIAQTDHESSAAQDCYVLGVDNEVEWQGWYVPNELEKPYSAAPYSTRLVFSCGLGYLDSVDYLNGTAYYTGRATELTILLQAMASIFPGGSLDADIHNAIGLLPTGGTVTDALSQTYIDQDKYINDDGTVKSCLYVVNDIISSYGARVIMGYTGWWIVRVKDYALLLEGKSMYYTDYNTSGVYQRFASLSSANVLQSVAGPYVTSRAEDIFWKFAPRMRHEFAYKKAEVHFDYQYRNILRDSVFSDNYDQFWVMDSACDVIQDTEDPNVNNAYIPGQSYSRSIEQTTVAKYSSIGGPGITLKYLRFSAEFFVETSSAVSSFDIKIEFYNTSSSVFITMEKTLSSEERTWVSFADTKFIPGGTTDPLTVVIYNPTCATAIDGVRVRNVELQGLYTYAPDFALPKTPETVIDKLSTTINVDNLETRKPLEMEVGDISLLNANEAFFFRGAKSLDTLGDALTTAWALYYIDSSGRAAIGPEQTLQEYLRDGLMSQHGRPRRRLSGELFINTPWWALMLLLDHDVYYLPTALTYYFTEGRMKLNVVEIPGKADNEILTTNLITGWTNVSWGSFASSGATISGLEAFAAGPTQEAESNEIEDLSSYSTFRIQVSVSLEDSGAWLELSCGEWSDTIANEYDEIINVGALGGDTGFTLGNGGLAMSHDGIVVKATRIYNY